MGINKKILGGVLVLVGAAIVPIIASAAPEADSRLTQQITAGVLSTDIRNASGTVIADPAFPMSAVVASTQPQTATGTFGSTTQRVTVDNPGGANGGWTLAWNASTPGTGVWESGANTYSYNGTAATGQLTVDPAAGALTAAVGGTAGVTLGSSAAFSGTTPVTLITAAANSADMWNGYVRGIGLSQTIPAGQAVGSYTLDMTQTVTAT